MDPRGARWAWFAMALSIACSSDEEPTSQTDASTVLVPGGGADASVPTPPTTGGGTGGVGGNAGGTFGGAVVPDASSGGTTGGGSGAPGGTFGGATPDSGPPGGGTMGGATPSDAGVVVPVTPSGPNCLKGTGDFNAKGPYKVKQTPVTIGSQGPYTIFAPDPLDTGCQHPLVAWGNGTGVSDSTTYGFYQEHAASWGIVVVAAHNSNVGNGSFHKAGIDYMLQQNMMQGSPFYQKLSGKVGTSGHSQGGMGANAGASHPSVSTIVNVQGAFGTAPRGKNFLCLTGTADINPAGCKSSVDGANAPAFLANWQGGDHTGTATLLGFITNDPGTKQYMRLYSAWFRCHLANDTPACAMFMGGSSCPLCKDKGWAEIYAKNY